MMSTLANAWIEGSHEVTFMTFDMQGLVAFELSTDIKLRRLPMLHISHNALQGLTSNLRNILILRRAIRESSPDIVICFTTVANVLATLSLIGLKTPVIVSERSDPSCFNVGFYWRVLRAITYPLAQAVVYQTENVAARVTRSARQNVVVIPNPVVLRGGMANRGVRIDSKQIFAMGRLEPVKGFDLLLHSFRLIADRHPDWSLTILGEGPERRNLQSLVSSLGLGGRVSLPGWAADPFVPLADAEFFVLSSRVEGFPNALCEAMACGVPVIAFNCPSGPSDIVRHEVDGLLIPPEDVNAMASAMDRLIGDRVERIRFGLRGPDVVQRFGMHEVLQRWTTLFHQVLSAQSSNSVRDLYEEQNDC